MPDIERLKAGYRIVPIPHLARTGRWRIEDTRSRPNVRIIWFTRGQGRITVQGVTRGFGPNNAVVLPAGTMHGFEMGPQVFGSIIDFPEDFAGPVPARPLHLRIREVSQQADFNAHLEAFQREINADQPGRTEALAAYATLMMIWAKRMAEAGAGDAVRDDATRRLANRYAALVEREFSAEKTVGGRSAHEVLNGRVIAEAHRLLAETQKPIREIAADLGYSSAAYFTRAFQKSTGTTPSDFRAHA
jgi:AraC-like DNA-binding protein